MASRPGFEPEPLLWEARALTIAPPLLCKESGIQDCLGLPSTGRVVSYCRVLCVRDPYPPGWVGSNLWIRHCGVVSE